MQLHTDTRLHPAHETCSLCKHMQSRKARARSQSHLKKTEKKPDNSSHISLIVTEKMRIGVVVVGGWGRWAGRGGGKEGAMNVNINCTGREVLSG